MILHTYDLEPIYLPSNNFLHFMISEFHIRTDQCHDVTSHTDTSQPVSQPSINLLHLKDSMIYAKGQGHNSMVNGKIKVTQYLSNINLLHLMVSEL